MATYYVDGTNGNNSNNGSSGSPWKTLAKARQSISNGDTVKIRTAVYKETLAINVANSTWEADTGHTPVLDGNYHEGLFSGGRLFAGKLPSATASASYLPGDVKKNMLNVNAAGVTVRGLTFTNIAGRAIGVGTGANNVLIEDNFIRLCAGGGIIVNPGGGRISNVVVRGNVMDLLSMKYFSPDTGAGQGGVQGALKVGSTSGGAIVEYNTVRRSFGEGINLGKGNDDLICRYNVVYDCNHVLMYNNRSDNTEIYGNLLFHTGDPVVANSSTGEQSAGLLFSDEVSGESYPKSVGGRVYNNIIVNCGKLFQVRNNHKVNSKTGEKEGQDTTLDGVWIAHNTFVAGPDTIMGIQINKNEWGQPHKNTVFENNIIDFQRAANGATVCQSNDVQGIAFRHNLWSQKPINSMAGTTGGQIGDPRLFNPGAVVRPSTTLDPTDYNCDPNNYRLTSNSSLAINKASDGSKFNGLTPPNLAVDYFGASRPVGAASDIGAHEFGGSVSSLVASFTQNSVTTAISGPQPFSVTFADTSTGSPSVWLWEFGDGDASTEENPTHVFNVPGTYQVVLRVRDDSGLESSTTGAPITVTTSGDIANVVVDVSRQGAKTTTGTQDYTAGSSGLVGKAHLYFWTNATSDGTAADGVQFGVGCAVAGDEQWAHVISTQHNTSPTNIWRRRITNGCWLSIDNAGVVTGRASHAAHIANGHRMNFTDAAPSAFLTTGIHFFGNGVQAKAGTTQLGAGGVPVPVDVGFVYDLLFMVTVGGQEDTATSHAFLSLGAALGEELEDETAAQFRRAWNMESGRGSTEIRFSPSSLVIGQLRGGDVIDGSKTAYVVSPATGSGFTVTATPQGGRTAVSWLALKLDGVRLFLSTTQTPAATDTEPYDGPEWEPQFLMNLLGLISEPETDPSRFDPTAGTFGVHVKGASGEYTNIASIEVDVSPTNDQSLSDNQFILPYHDGSGPAVSGTNSFTSTGWDFAATVDSDAGQYLNVSLAIEKAAAAPDGPVAGFSITPRTGTAPLEVTGKDLSDPNGATISSWLWEWGDEETSSTQNPTHTYQEPGTYTVSLTVTNSNGSDTETKNAYIVVTTAEQEQPEFLAPHDPLPITNKSIDRLHNATGDPLRGYHEHSLDQDVIYVDITPEEVGHKPGKMHLNWINNRNGFKYLGAYVPGAQENIIPAWPFQQFYYDSANGRFLFQLRNGNWRAISTSAVDVGGDPGDVGEGSVIAQIANGLHDGREVSGVVELSNSSAINISARQRYAILYFPSITIPIGATITSAKLDLYLYAANLSSPNGIEIWADDSDSATAPAETTNNISGRTPTSAVVTWNGTNLGKGTRSTPDIKSVIQEVSDRGGRSATFNLAVIMRGASSTAFTFWPYERGASDAATLRIDYTT